MSAQSKKTSIGAFRGAALALLISCVASPSLAQRPAEAVSGPFEGLAGQWSGNGTISMTSGASERIRCKVTYYIQSAGKFLQQDLRCASDSYKFELKSNVVHEAGAITGTWQELTRKANGSVSGTASRGEIQARVESPVFSANLSIATRGDRQSVMIKPQGADVADVSITLSRSR